MTNRDIESAARILLGIPWRHQGRTMQGLDCVGLLIEVAKRLGLEHMDVTSYTMRPSPDELMSVLNSCCDKVSLGEAEEGDILVFFFVGKGWPQHVGIKSRHGMIHTARSGKGQVTEEQLNEDWMRKLHSAWRYRWQR